MKRDLELIKRILIRLDELEDASNDEYRYEDFGFEDIDKDTFYFHTKIMARENLIAANKEAYISYDYPLYIPLHVLPTGMEFLRIAKNNTAWMKMLDYVESVADKVTLAVLVSKAVAWFS